MRRSALAQLRGERVEPAAPREQLPLALTELPQLARLADVVARQESRVLMRPQPRWLSSSAATEMPVAPGGGSTSTSATRTVPAAIWRLSSARPLLASFASCSAANLSGRKLPDSSNWYRSHDRRDHHTAFTSPYPRDHTKGSGRHERVHPHASLVGQMTEVAGFTGIYLSHAPGHPGSGLAVTTGALAACALSQRRVRQPPRAGPRGWAGGAPRRRTGPRAGRAGAWSKPPLSDAFDPASCRIGRLGLFRVCRSGPGPAEPNVPLRAEDRLREASALHTSSQASTVSAGSHV